MSNYKKQSLLNLISFLVFTPLLTWYFVNPKTWLLVLVLIIGLIIIFLHLAWYWTNIRNLLAGLLFILVSITFVVMSLSIKINFQYGKLSWLSRVDIIYRFIIILVCWTIIYHLLIKNITNLSYIKTLFGHGLEKTDDWKALPTDNEQGTDINELELEGKLLEQLTFRIIPKSTFWRAGFKIVFPDGGALPLLMPQSILIHLASEDNGKIGIYIYYFEGGPETKKYKKQILNSIKVGMPIDISVKINDKNFMQCLVNGVNEFEERIDHGYRKKAYLLAWGDGNDYEVDFKNISFKKK
jgi:hypothetical protein